MSVKSIEVTHSSFRIPLRSRATIRVKRSARYEHEETVKRPQLVCSSSNSDATILSASRLESPLALTCCAVSVSHQSRFAKPGFASASDVYSRGPHSAEKARRCAESARPACSEAAVAAGLRRRPRGQQGGGGGGQYRVGCRDQTHQARTLMQLNPVRGGTGSRFQWERSARPKPRLSRLQSESQPQPGATAYSGARRCLHLPLVKRPASLRFTRLQFAKFASTPPLCRRI